MSLSALSEQITADIRQSGPIQFDRFMEAALYTPGLGYYSRDRERFGTGGDFFTAEQIQPVFGILIAQYAAQVREELGAGDRFRFIELGAGRGEMEPALRAFAYTPIDIERGSLDGRSIGIVFANEFFDALPVRVVVNREGELRERLVDENEGAFRFVDGPPIDDALRSYMDRFHPELAAGEVLEVNLRALEWLDRIAHTLDRGCLLAIDYGYTRAEWLRYSAGTLMSYRKHQASVDVLSDPGDRDITAHVPFTMLEQAGVALGFEIARFETLARFLLNIGEKDQFAAALQSESEREAFRRRMQLKTLLFGMGETFRVLELRKRWGK